MAISSLRCFLCASETDAFNPPAHKECLRRLPEAKERGLFKSVLRELEAFTEPTFRCEEDDGLRQREWWAAIFVEYFSQAPELCFSTLTTEI